MGPLSVLATAAIRRSLIAAVAMYVGMYICTHVCMYVCILRCVHIFQMSRY